MKLWRLAGQICRVGQQAEDPGENLCCSLHLISPYCRILSCSGTVPSEYSWRAVPTLTLKCPALGNKLHGQPKAKGSRLGPRKTLSTSPCSSVPNPGKGRNYGQAWELLQLRMGLTAPHSPPAYNDRHACAQGRWAAQLTYVPQP